MATLARRDASLFETEEMRALGAEKRAADRGTQLFRRKRTKTSELSLGSPRETSNSVTPAQESGAHDLADCRVGPAGRDQLLQNADIAGRDVLVEIVTCPIPWLRDLQRVTSSNKRP